MISFGNQWRHLYVAQFVVCNQPMPQIFGLIIEKEKVKVEYAFGVNYANKSHFISSPLNQLSYTIFNLKARKFA